VNRASRAFRRPCSIASGLMRRLGVADVLAACLLVLLLVPGAWAGSINEVRGLAIHGYDPVAYFTDGRAVAGLPRFKTRHEGAELREAWSKDIPGHIEKADRNWPEVAKTTRVYR